MANNELTNDERMEVLALRKHLDDAAATMDALAKTGIAPGFNVNKGQDGKHRVENFTITRNTPVSIEAIEAALKH